MPSTLQPIKESFVRKIVVGEPKGLYHCIQEFKTLFLTARYVLIIVIGPKPGMDEIPRRIMASELVRDTGIIGDNFYAGRNVVIEIYEHESFEPQTTYEPP